MKILSVHPFSLYSNGGGSRILRRLYQGREVQVTSLVAQEFNSAPNRGEIEESFVYAFPVTRKWMRWYLRDGIIWLRHKVFKSQTEKRIRKAAKFIACDVVHIVQHGPFPAALCESSFLEGKELWVSFHDHYSTTHTTREDAEKLWNSATRRLAISDEYGREYQRLFGDKPYEIITDGVDGSEISLPSNKLEQPITIYFAGLLHMHYQPLFRVLADALDLLSKQANQFKLVLRATQYLEFLDNRSFITEYKPLTLNNAELKEELDAASILYLPIKFTMPDFYLYSLSTKMVGYLGASGAIFYHGPLDSAACNMLQAATAAECCGTLNVDDVARAITRLINNKSRLSQNAKLLAQKKFNLATIQQQFWQIKLN